MIYTQKLLPYRKNIYLGDWLDRFVSFFSLFVSHSSSSVWYVFEFVFKTAFFFLTASAAKEAVLPYFPQIVEYLKVTQDNFFTVYSEVDLVFSHDVMSPL